jgi:hypothetical protein
LNFATLDLTIPLPTRERQVEVLEAEVNIMIKVEFRPRLSRATEHALDWINLKPFLILPYMRLHCRGTQTEHH